MPIIKEFSIQLYSIREQTEKDFAGSLKKLGEFGYNGVEFAGYGGIAAADMRKLLDGNGLTPVGSHITLEKLEKSLDAELEYNSVLGTEYIIVPYSAVKSKDDVLRVADTINAIGEKCLAAGFKFGYHNHDHEFAVDKDSGKYLLDILFDNLNKGFCMELDVFWAAAAGIDYLGYMKRNKDRLKLLHVKQIENMESRRCVDLSQGIIDIKEAALLGNECGVAKYILEQEEFAGDPFDSLRSNYDYIMSL